MKKKKFLFLFVLLMMFSFKVKASTCSDTRILELSSLANNVKVGYEDYNADYDKVYYNEQFDEETRAFSPAFYITIYNLTDDLNASIVNDADSSQKATYVTSEDKEDDGVIYVDTGLADKIKTYTIKIRSNDSNCQNEVLKVSTVTVPMYNRFYEYAACGDYPDFDLCKEYTSSDYSAITDREFRLKLEEYKSTGKSESQQNTIVNGFMRFVRSYWVYLVIIAVLIVGIIVFEIIKKRRSRLV